MTERISVAEYRALCATGQALAVKRRQSPEEDLQLACVEWASLLARQHPLLRWLTHVPNGGKRPRGAAGRLKALGTKKGFPDLILPRRNGPYTGLVVELKSPKGPVTPEQAEWLEAFESDGYLTGVCRTLEAFQDLVYRYLEN